MTPPSARADAARIQLVENRFRGAIAASLDAFFLCECIRDDAGGVVDFRLVELNGRGENFLGRSRADVVGRPVTELLPLLREHGLIDSFAQVVATGESFEDELRFRAPDGTTRWVRHSVVRVDDGIAITSRDITKRKQIAESLAESEARFRHLVESATDGIYRIDPYGIFTYANPIASRLLGFAPDEPGIVGRLYLDFVRRDYHEQGIALYRRQIVERTPVTYWEFPAIALDGNELWIGQNVHIEQEHGRLTSLFAVARDITKQKQAELALRESEARHRFLAENSTDMLARTTPGGTILYASPVCLTLLGYAADELVGRSVFEYVHADDLEAVRASSARLLGHREIETLTYRIRRHDGSYVWFETTSQAVRDDASGRPVEVLSVSRDVTERRRLEDELRQAQKMEAVAQLAGGVAHDFNNLLTAIRGFTDLLARSVQPDDPRRADIGEIVKATERAAALTRQLLAFSKRQVLRLESLSINDVVDDMAKIVRRLVGESITVETELAEAAWPVRADPGQLEQVLLNLALNARDAMRKGGTLRISTRNVEVAGPSTPDAVLAPGKYVVLVVSDSGTGMSEETRAHAFEPFFTTKEQAGRAGLGLATVYGIVTQSGGRISVASELGRGTTVTIHLPVTDASLGTPSGDGTRPRSVAGNVVLVAEDNEGVRALTVRVLADAGYQVLEACDGLEALEVLRGLREPIDMLISDVMMPRMSGTELAAQFQRLQPGSPILLMSGYMDEESVRRSFADPSAVLPKPFSPEVLLARVEEAIGAKR
ncbi:MAG TPA: PAS domain S-box protein [Gemmatimonadaceae bacterium]|nr:PAS domain S-box protein [Gemmatimonadaceae bacterium]